jgi:hypothetical protein
MRRSHESLYGPSFLKKLVLVCRKVVKGERKAHSQTGSKSDPIHMSVLTTQVWARPLAGSRLGLISSKICVLSRTPVAETEAHLVRFARTPNVTKGTYRGVLTA